MMNYQRHAIGINMPQAPQTSYIQPAIQMPAQVQRQKPARALVGFANVPKFTPPTYDGVAPEDLPCPDTPSPRGSLVSSPDDEKDGQLYKSGGNNNLADDYVGVRAEGTRNHNANRRPMNVPSQEARSKALTPSKDTNAVKKEENASQPFPPGSFVEYRSRTMQDRWILAKVEAFDEKNRVYKLDVQPKAPMDRVRLRQAQAPAVNNRTGDALHADQQAAPEGAVQSSLSVEKSIDQKRKVDALHDVIDPYEDEKISMVAAIQNLSEPELRSRVEQLITENMHLKQQLDSERQRSTALESQLRLHIKVDL